MAEKQNVQLGPDFPHAKATAGLSHQRLGHAARTLSPISILVFVVLLLAAVCPLAKSPPTTWVDHQVVHRSGCNSTTEDSEESGFTQARPAFRSDALNWSPSFSAGEVRSIRSGNKFAFFPTRSDVPPTEDLL
jgi:hypothetical protein